MKMRISTAIAFCTGLLLVACNSSDPRTEIADYLDDLAAKGSFSGVVLVAHDREPILERAYGLANRDYEIPNQIDTKFNLGSMNKMFTAIAVMQLVQRGELAVDDTIIELLPDYANKEVSSQVKIHHLLTHTSGLGDFFTTQYMEASKDHFRTLSDHLPLFVDRPLQFEPGLQSSYSNAGYIVLGLVIEEITGKSYFDYVRENIFQPCGMTNTDSYEVDKVVPNIATGYSRHEGLSSNLLFLPAKGSSAGGGYSTAGDMLSFSICLVNHRLLSPELTNILLEGKVDLRAGGKYGYGFNVNTMNNHLIVGHGGGAPGICSNLDILPNLGYTVVILSNSDFDCWQVITAIRGILIK